MTADSRKFLSAGQVAYLLGGKTVDWFYRNRRKLEAQGFPKPCLGGCYDPLALYAWRLAQLEPGLRAVLAAAHPALDVGAGEPTPDHEAELRANAERIADRLGHPGSSAISE